MILVVIYSVENFQIKIPESTNFVILQTGEVYEKQLKDNTWKIDKEEGWANEIAQEIKERAQEYTGIIIDKYHGTQNWQRAVRLAGHIALTIEEESICPIFLTDFDTIDIESTELKGLPILDFFQCTGVYFKSYSELFRRSKNKQTGEEEYAVESLLRKCKKVSWEEFYVPFKHDNRHQISNEWGAISLALNAGYEKSEISYDYPETLYFKFLQRKFHPNSLNSSEIRKELDDLGLSTISEDKIDLSSLLNGGEILLIDDNSDKGWSAVLAKIFNCRITTKESIKDALAMDKEEYEKNVLVFLDLYLPPDPEGKPTNTYSFKLLRGLKDRSPDIPIIVFTASNKSWTLDKVLNQGADGMYVKESPLFVGDRTYSKENFFSFLKTVHECINKYSILKPFWEGIQNIRANYLSLIKDSSNEKFKSRITERLDMFFGLLKRGFEQNSYNKEKFFFDDNELAFMTLWSILNDIKEAYFEKDRPNIALLDNGGNTLTHHPAPNNRKISYLPHHFRWKIRSQSDVFVEYEYSLKYDSNSIGTPQVNYNGFYMLKHDQISQFSFKRNIFSIGARQATRTNYETTIFMQIAFLLEKMVSLSSSNKAQYQQELVRLNEIRNHLYLTHGADISSNFYANTELDKRRFRGYNITPGGDIKRLFELTGFLLTGKEIKVTF